MRGELSDLGVGTANLLDLKHVIYDVVCDIWLSCIQQTDARRNDEPVQVWGSSDTRAHKHTHMHTHKRACSPASACVCRQLLVPV